jgi:hypothetical protein
MAETVVPKCPGFWKLGRSRPVLYSMDTGTDAPIAGRYRLRCLQRERIVQCISGGNDVPMRVFARSSGLPNSWVVVTEVFDPNSSQTTPGFALRPPEAGKTRF